MLKPLIRWIVVFSAALIVLLIVFRNRLPFGTENSSFGVGNEKEITSVEFDSQGKKLTFNKNGEKWFMDGHTEVRKSGILFLLRVLHEIRIKSPVSPELFASEITGKGIEPVRVRVYEGRRKIGSFYVYKTRSNPYGNIMKVSGGSKPFIVYVPGYDGDIGSAFTMNELFWQPYNVFNLLPSEIVSVGFENLSDTSASFSILSRDHRYLLTAGSRNLAGWDTALVKRYLSYFAWIPFESWALDMTDDEKAATISRPPVYRISVSTAEGKSTVLTLWEKYVPGEGKDSIDSDRLLGKTGSGTEFFIMRYFDIDPIIKKRSYFFRE